MYFLADNLMQRTMVEITKMVATKAKTAITMRHCCFTPLVEQGSTSLLDESFDGSQGAFVVDGAELVVDPMT